THTHTHTHTHAHTHKHTQTHTHTPLQISPWTCICTQTDTFEAFSTIQHIFSNGHIPQKVLREMDSKTGGEMSLNTHPTRCVIFQRREDGGLWGPTADW